MRTVTVVTIITNTIIMDPDASTEFLYLLQVTNSSFPTGAFKHSFGFETWIDVGEVGNARELEIQCRDWLEHSVTHGDAAIVAQARRAVVAGDAKMLVRLDRICAAIKLSREAREASEKTGHALQRALRDVFDWDGAQGYIRAVSEGECEGHYPVVFGAFAGGFGVAESSTVLAYLFSLVSNLVGVAARLIPLGQVESQRIVRDAWPALRVAADAACRTDLDMIRTATPGLDIASMRHERLHTRLCMS